ncbi:uncharacterized, partial [Tachysurus ichikawai]
MSRGYTVVERRAKASSWPSAAGGMGQTLAEAQLQQANKLLE